MQHIYIWLILDFYNAVEGKSIEKVRELLQNGNVEIDFPNEHGATALHRCARTGHVELVSLLLTHKADVNVLNKSGETALHLASRYGESVVVQALFSHNADPNIQNNQRIHPYTELHVTAILILLNYCFRIMLIHLLRMMRVIQPYT